jgi:hypothetical protein
LEIIEGIEESVVNSVAAVLHALSENMLYLIVFVSDKFFKKWS